MKTEKQITMSLDLAKQMLGKDEAMDMLIKQNFSNEELGIKPKLPKKWEDIESINGYFINNHSMIIGVDGESCSSEDKNILPTKELAEAMLALCQLLYFRDIYNDGWEPNWVVDPIKYNISCLNNKVVSSFSHRISRSMSFKTEQLRDEFLENFKDLLEIAKPLL